MKYVYNFKDGNKDMRETLGGKGANLCEMTNLHLPIPKGFIVSTKACLKYYDNDSEISEKILLEIEDAIATLEKETGKKFGNPEKPLLVSVRSGARASMPGMMDTILNLGLNDELVNSKKLKLNKRFVLDCYRRFISMYSDVVKGFDKNEFEGILERFKKERNLKYDTELTEDNLRKLVLLYKAKYHSLEGSPFPSDPKEQLKEAIMAVFRSWNNDRAKYYRELNNIPDDWGTAVNVQEMVYGNFNDNSATGVLFSRNPATGENKLYGEYMINAQGEDIVAGVRTPENLDKLKVKMPVIYDQLCRYSKKLERYYQDMQDMEFTIENGKLYILQTRNGKRTGKAAIKIATEMYEEKLIKKEELLNRVSADDLNSVLHKTFKQEDLKTKDVVTTGIAASPGAGSGKVYFTSADISKAYEAGERELILVRSETSAEDIEGMNKASAVVTVRGGMTSHAAVVARGMGTPCVSGCENLVVDEANKVITSNGKNICEGDYISVDGTNGKVYFGKLPTEETSISDEFKRFVKYISELGLVEVRANADNPKDAKRALLLGAKGIGLCRTEHMFFDDERIISMRKMILSENQKEREEALKELLPYQRNDFIKLFEVMNGLPVTIRLLDPPLHEFLPKDENEVHKLALELNVSEDYINKRIDDLKEFNPMMGHRGIRLGITYPEIIKMQAKAIFEALISVKTKGIKVKPEIMIPLVGTKEELTYAKKIIENVHDDVINSLDNNYMIGTMIEIPRASIIADTLAKEVEFFSFGTNDLTQMTYGFSRDDAGKFLNDYYDKKILDFNPFEKLDQVGVGKLIKDSIVKGKKANEKLELGVCGEQGADEDSIKFLTKAGIDYVSCSPYRIPAAILASAKAAVDVENNK